MNFQYTYGGPYPQQDIMLARANLRHLVWSVRGKAMDSIRYKTGIGNHSCHVRRHNNEWQRSALTSHAPPLGIYSPDQSNYFRMQEDQHYQLRKSYPWQQDTGYQPEINYNNQPVKGFKKSNQSSNVYQGQSDTGCDQSDEDSSSQSASNLSDHTAESSDSYISKPECSRSENLKSSTTNPKPQKVYIHIDQQSPSTGDQTSCQNQGKSRKRSYTDHTKHTSNK